MLSATLSCSSKTSSSEPPKRSAQRCAPLSASISCAVIRTRPAAFRTEHIADAEFAADLLHLDYLALVGEGRIAGDDEEPPDARQRGDDLLDHAVGEIFLLRIAAILANGSTATDGLAGSGNGGSAAPTLALCALSSPACGEGLGRGRSGRTRQTRTGRVMFLSACPPI